MPNQTALITGASSGIGRSLAQLFARDKYDLVLTARRAGPLQELASELARLHGVSARVMPADLAQPDGARQLHAELQRAGIAIDVLVNNAGFGLQGAFAALPLEGQLQMIHLNVTTPTVLTRLLIPSMLERGRGGVLTVGSTAGFQPGPFMAVYYATKAYVDSFSEAIAEELAGSRLRITCLAPGPTTTGFAERAGASDARLFESGMMSADEVASIGYEAWKKGKPLVIAGAKNRLRQLTIRIAPRSVVRKAVRRLNTRGS